jgi:hypothetical protein
METITVRVSAEGIAFSGMRATYERRRLYDARAAISCLHDALLAVAQGKITPDQVKDFFWNGRPEMGAYFGDVLDFSEKKE